MLAPARKARGLDGDLLDRRRGLDDRLAAGAGELLGQRVHALDAGLFGGLGLDLLGAQSVELLAHLAKGLGVRGLSPSPGRGERRQH